MQVNNIGAERPRSKRRKGFYYSTVLKIINGESTKDLKTAWLQYVVSQGHRMRGLAKRRLEEYNIYANNIYKKFEVSKKDWLSGEWKKEVK